MSLSNIDRLRIKAGDLEGLAKEIAELADNWEDELQWAKEDGYKQGYDEKSVELVDNG